MSDLPRLSVVLATYNRSASLRTTLISLEGQTLRRDQFEVIVVDDGSTDDTPQMVDEYLKTTALPLRYIRQENRGPGYTANIGIRESAGLWVLLLCDDMHCQPTTLEAHYRAHERHPEDHFAVAGKVLQSPDLPRTVFHKNWDPFRFKAVEQRDELPYFYFCACHVSFKKAFVLRHGLFLERRGAAQEDTEAGWRFQRDGGMRLLYCKEAITYHYHIEDIDSARRRAYERGRNVDVLLDHVKDPTIFIRIHLVTWNTIRPILQAFRTSSQVVVPEDRNRVWFFVREVLRRIVFNRMTVPWLWLPLIRRAETSPLLARLVTPMVLRGVVSHHFLLGVREMRHRRAAEGAEPLPV